MCRLSFCFFVCAVVGISSDVLGGSPTVVDFESAAGHGALEHGRIISTSIADSVISARFADLGLTIITAVNLGGGPDLAAVFDSRETGTRDPDLEGPTSGSWAMGNIASDEELGNIVIIAENNWGGSDGVLNYPDDEGSRPAGTLTFEFDPNIDSIGFDLVDVEGTPEFSGGFFAAFYDGSTEIGAIPFQALVDSGTSFGSRFVDPTIQFGNNSANRISPFTLAELNIAFGTNATSFNKVVIGLGGSGAIDNLTFTTASTVPEPSSVVLLALLAAAGATVRNRSQLEN